MGGKLKNNRTKIKAALNLILQPLFNYEKLRLFNNEHY